MKMGKRIVSICTALFLVIFCMPAAGAAGTYMPYTNLRIELSLAKGYSLLMVDENETVLHVMNGFTDDACSLPAKFSVSVPSGTAVYFIPAKQVVEKDPFGESVITYKRQAFAPSTIVQGKGEDAETISVPENTNTFYLIPYGLLAELNFQLTPKEAPEQNEWDEMLSQVLTNVKPKVEKAYTSLTSMDPAGFQEKLFLDQNESVTRSVKSPRGAPEFTVDRQGVITVELIGTAGDVYTYRITSISWMKDSAIVKLQMPGEDKLTAWRIYANYPGKTL